VPLGRDTKELRWCFRRLLGEAGKAEDAKLLGAGIIPKKCPNRRKADQRVSHQSGRSRVRKLVGG
jgi:hypothetical protein